ncbi:MAG: LacI family DNA-binding transcriptional regulator, partial [Rhodospirillales bacterium]
MLESFLRVSTSARRFEVSVAVGARFGRTLIASCRLTSKSFWIWHFLNNSKDEGEMTLRRLADELGLSPTTVSRALAGYDDVAAATRAKVVRAAKRLGYVPNAAAAGFRT